MSQYNFQPVDEKSDTYISTKSNDHMLNSEELKHQTMFGKCVRVGIIGPSNSGKTTLLKEFIKKTDMFKYTKIIVYAAITTIESGFYKTLYETAPEIISLIPIDLIEPLDRTNLDPKESYMIIFDDIATVKNKKIIEAVESFFAYGSKRNMHLFYLTQGYTGTAFSKTMRKNITSYIIMQGTENDEIDLLFRQIVGKNITDTDKQILKEKLDSRQFNYLIIAKPLSIEDGKYRVNNDIYTPQMHRAKKHMGFMDQNRKAIEVENKKHNDQAKLIADKAKEDKNNELEIKKKYGDLNFSNKFVDDA